MTRVEELRELRNALDDLIETEATKILTAHQFLELPGFDKIMDAIVAVARSEGVAEGAEQERERIRGLSREFKTGDTLIINAPTLLVELSVLRPRKHGPAPKEDDNGNN